MSRSVRVAEYSEFNWKEQSTDVVKYSEIINFERAGTRGEHHCVMCGRVRGVECEIPNQNKDVCKTCDSAYWRLLRDDVIVKFCKGILLCQTYCIITEFIIRMQKVFVTIRLCRQTRSIKMRKVPSSWQTKLLLQKTRGGSNH
jgi:hypothetical protein